MHVHMHAYMHVSGYENIKVDLEAEVRTCRETSVLKVVLKFLAKLLALDYNKLMFYHPITRS